MNTQPVPKLIAIGALPGETPFDNAWYVGYVHGEQRNFIHLEKAWYLIKVSAKRETPQGPVVFSQDMCMPIFGFAPAEGTPITVPRAQDRIMIEPSPELRAQLLGMIMAAAKNLVGQRSNIVIPEIKGARLQ